MNHSIIPSTRFKKPIKKHLKFIWEDSVFKIIKSTKSAGFISIPPKMKPLKLIGNYKDCLDCHILLDLLLIWEQNEIKREIYFLDV